MTQENGEFLTSLSKISAMSNEDVARAFARLNQRKRAEVSTRFLQNQNKSIEDARAELMAEIETKLPADLFKTARNLANRRNITMRVAVDKLVDNAQGRALGFLHNKNKRVRDPEMVLSLDDINLETPLHETVHRFVRDLFESSKIAFSSLIFRKSEAISVIISTKAFFIFASTPSYS